MMVDRKSLVCWGGLVLAAVLAMGCWNSNPPPPPPKPAPPVVTPTISQWPPGYQLEGCAAIGHSCSELCPGKCEILPPYQDSKLCPNAETPIACVCNCPG